MGIFLGLPYKGPCIVEVRGPDYAPSKYYGPFPSIRESKTWMNIQYEQGFTGTFSICPIYTPYRTRSYEDWWMSDHLRNAQSHLLDVPSKPWFKLRGWRKWLRSVSEIHYKAYMNEQIEFEDLPHETQLKYISVAFQTLCSTGTVPYGVQTGDDDTWDNYGPAIELARDNYYDDMSLS